MIYSIDFNSMGIVYMDFQTPKITFSLRANDISTSNVVADYPLTNIKGSISEYRTTITWNAINFKNLLGELYNHYDLFNIQLINTGWSLPAAAFGVTTNDRGINVVMSGLDWAYNNYNTITGNMTNECIIGNAFINPVNAANVGFYPGQQVATFRKCITADITISVETVLGGVPDLAAGTMYPQLSYMFIVTPVV